METYAYIRVSSREQKTDRQLEALNSFDLPEKNIYCDHQSGKDFERPAYRRLMGTIKEGDFIIVKSIDRLGRNYNDILQQWQFITKIKGVDILVLDMPLLDTRDKDKGLTGTLIADLILQILAYVAETERNMIRERQAEGIAIAKERGVMFGPRPKPMPDDFEKFSRLCVKGEYTIRKAAECLGVSTTTFFRRFKEWKKNQG